MLEFEVRGDKEIKEKMKELPPKIVRGTKDAMSKAVLMVARDAIKKAPVDTGRLRASIGGKVKVMGGEIVGVVGSNVTYAPYVEFGRRAGSRMPPVKAIEEWATRVIGESGLGFVIARAIATRGIRPKRYLTEAIEKNKRSIERLLAGALEKVVREANR